MRQRLRGWTKMPLATFVAGGIVLSATYAQSGVPSSPPSATAEPSTGSHGSARRPNYELTTSARQYYQRLWGVEILGVKPVSSGTMIRFSYRVVDADKAKTLNDKQATPRLVDQKTGATLVVPTMEKVGQLRQSSTPENGREYWMLFSNQGNLVRPGNRVDVVIGNFRAEGLIVRSD